MIPLSSDQRRLAVLHPDLAKELAGAAIYELLFTRQPVSDQRDEFAVDVQRLARAEPAARDAVLTSGDVVALTPMGNDWLPSVGRSSYVIIPFSVRHHDWLYFGLEEIVAHPTRGANPIAHGFILSRRSTSFDTIERMFERCAADLSGGEQGRPDRLASGTLPLVAGTCLDARMLRTAARHYGQGGSMFVRTRLLAPSLHPHELASLGRFLTAKVDAKPFIVGIPAATFATSPVHLATIAAASHSTAVTDSAIPWPADRSHSPCDPRPDEGGLIALVLRFLKSLAATVRVDGLASPRDVLGERRATRETPQQVERARGTGTSDPQAGGTSGPDDDAPTLRRGWRAGQS